jgi:hypothetical protein
VVNTTFVFRGLMALSDDFVISRSGLHDYLALCAQNQIDKNSSGMIR